MSVGDFVKIRLADRACRVHRLVANFAEAPTTEDFGHSRLFVSSPGRTEYRYSLSSRLRLGISKLLGIERLLAWWRSRPTSLIRFMSRTHDVGVQQSELGVEAIGIPFPHVLLLTTRDYGGYRVALENRLSEQLNQYWANYVDPLVGIRVRMITSSRARENELVAFLGDGVFVPRAGERPVGRVEIKFETSKSALQLTIANVPAGVYRGQSSLAFSGSERITPATNEALSGLSGTFCVRPRPHDETAEAYTLDWDPPNNGDQVFAPVIDTIQPALPEVDGAFRVRFADSTTFEVRVVENEQYSRLYHAPCGSELCFAIVGIVAPTKNQHFDVERWWIDIDRKGHLVASAMRLPKYSLVCERGVLSTWDWSAPRLSSSYPAFLQEFETPTGRTTVLLAPHGSPFGWLDPPLQTTRSIFVPNTDPGWSFDWLDFSGAVQDRNYQTERFGYYLHNSGTDASIPGTAGGEQSGSTLFRGEGQSEFLHSSDNLREGTWILTRPFVLQVVKGRGR